MVKKQAGNGGADVASIKEAKLTAAQRSELAKLKRPIIEAAGGFAGARQKIVDLAPRMLAHYNSIVQSNGGVYPFVNYCRLFDPSIPTHAGDQGAARGYRNHPVYYGMSYMKQVANRQALNAGQTQAGAGARNGRGQGVRDTAADDLARLIATILSVAKDPEAVWAALEAELGYSPNVMTRLRDRVAATKPLFALKVKPVPVSKDNIIHMERRAPQQQTGNAGPLQTPNARVTMDEAGSGRARRRA